MAKYQFRFASILKVKETLEKKIQEEISVINMKIEQLNKQQLKINEERLKAIAQMNKVSVKVSDYQSMKMYNSHLEQQIELIKKEIENLLGKREAKQKELIEKKKEIKAFETLKENDYKNYLIEERRSELKVLNEVAIRNFNGEQS